MKTLKQIGRVLAIIIASLVIVLSVAGIAGSWWANMVLTDVTNRMTSLVNSGVAIAETGVQQADQLVTDGRAEVQNTSTTVTTVGQNLEENSPVLTALSDRVETRLGPTVDQMRTTLEPAVNALRTVDQVLSVVNAIPFIKQDAPRLQKLGAAVDGLTQLAADVQQMRTTLRETVVSGKNQLTGEAVSVITDIATRIDTRLADLQSTLQTAQAEIDDLQVRSDALNARLLLIYNLAAGAATLLFLWILYSQIVLIRYQWRGLRSSGGQSQAAALPAASPAPPVASASPVIAPAPAAVEAVQSAEMPAAESADDETTEAINDFADAVESVVG